MSVARMMQMAAAGVSAGGGDPYFSNVTCLLHFDGSNGGTTFTDSAGNCAMSRVNATTTTSVVKYGTASGNFTNTGAYVYVSSALTGVADFGTGDFTVEMYVYRTTSARDIFFDTRQDGQTSGHFTLSTPTSGSKLQIVINGTIYTSTNAIPINEWVHIAATREGGTVRGFINGVLDLTFTNSFSITDGTNSTYPPLIGATGNPWGATSTNNFDGYLDDFRVTKGVARYTASFTPPTEPFPDSGTSPAPAEWTDPDLDNASYDSVSFSVGGQELAVRGIFFKPDGTKMYVIGETGDDVNEYDLSTAWLVSTASFLQNFSISAQETSPTSIFFKPDGTKMYVLGRSGDDVNEYDLSTAWDVSTSVYLQNFSVVAQDNAPWGIFFKPDGTKMYVLGQQGDDVNEYDLSSAWNVSTASFVQNFSVATQEATPTEINFNPDGTKMFIVGTASDSVREYDLSAAWDISTAVYNSVSFSVAAQETNPYTFRFKSDGSKLYVLGSGTTVYQYSTA
jgi:hypothetical protein